MRRNSFHFEDFVVQYSKGSTGMSKISTEELIW